MCNRHKVSNLIEVSILVTTFFKFGKNSGPVRKDFVASFAKNEFVSTNFDQMQVNQIIFEGFWRITSKINANIEVRKQ